MWGRLKNYYYYHYNQQNKHNNIGVISAGGYIAWTVGRGSYHKRLGQLLDGEGCKQRGWLRWMPSGIYVVTPLPLSLEALVRCRS